MADSFGARLRRQREERQIDLIAVAAQSKIKLALLEGLERDDVSQWPAGIFRRAYIRTYARLIALDPEAVLREFLEFHPDPVDALAEAAAALAAVESTKGAPPTRLRTMVDSALGSLARLRRPGVAEDASSDRTRIQPSPATTVLTPAPPAAQHDSHQEHADVDRLKAAPATADPRVDALPGPTPQPEPEQHSIDASDERVDSAIEASPQQLQVGADEALGELGETERAVEPSVNIAVVEAETALARLDAIAHLCTQFGRVVERSAIQRLLEESAGVLDAAGLIVWIWDDFVEELQPALVHGYSDKMLKYLPTVKRDDDNATAAAFRSAQTCEVTAAADMTGALVLPLLAAHGCVGVLAIELQQGTEPARPVRALATVLAAALTQVVYRSQPPKQRTQNDQPARGGGRSTPPIGPAKVRY